MNKRIALLTIALFSFTVTMAQSSVVKRANKYYNRLNYRTAADLYEKAVKTNKSDATALENLADCYKQLGDNENASKTYSKIIGSTSNPATILKYAQVLSSNGQYDEAKGMYDRYASLTADEGAKNFSKSLSSVNNFYRDSANYDVKFLEINSLQSDFAPAFYKDGFLFTSARVEKGAIKRSFGRDKSAFLDLYYSKDNASVSYDKDFRVGNSKMAQKATGLKSDKNTGWTENTPAFPSDVDVPATLESRFLSDKSYSKEKVGKQVDRFNAFRNKNHDGPVIFFDSYKKALVTRNHKKKAKDGFQKLKLVLAESKDGKSWKEMDVPFNNVDYSVGHGAITADGKKVYFVSDKSDSKGGTDLYQVDYLGDNKWGDITPVAQFNTAGNEMFPYITEEGDLFYSTNGFPGLGGLDIFRAEKNNGSFKKPVNMGYPLNSNKDDFGVILKKNPESPNKYMGYFSSNRKRELNDDDIYSFNWITECRTKIEAIVKNETNNKIVPNAKVDLKDATGKVIETTTSDESGKVFFNNVLCEKGGRYTLVATHDPLLPAKNVKSIETNGTSDPISLELTLKDKPVALKEEIVLKGCAYDMKGNKLPNTRVELVNLSTKETETFMTDDGGCYTKGVKANIKYEIFAYAADKDFIPSPSDLTNFSTIGMTKGEVIRDFHFAKGEIDLPELFYDLDEYYIRPDAADILDRVINIMQRFPNLELELQSHTDCRASMAYNQKLSQNRAESAYRYITGQYDAKKYVTTNQKYKATAKGAIKTERLPAKTIAPARLGYKGYGETQLRLQECSCEGPDTKTQALKCTEEQHQQNRRTTLRVTKN